VRDEEWKCVFLSTVLHRICTERPADFHDYCASGRSNPLVVHSGDPPDNLPRIEVRPPSKNTCAAGPYSNIALQQRSGLIRSRRQISAAATDEVKIEARYRIDQLAYNHFPITTRGYPE
jgi:hypothetical protein